MKIKPVSLKFDLALEQEFIKDYNINSLSFIRLALILTIVLYAMFAILDIWIIPVTRPVAWLIRFGIVIPFVAAMIALSYVKKFQPYTQSALLLTGVVTGFGISAMIAFTKACEIGYQRYYAGLMLVIFGIYTILRLRFYYAIISSLIVVASYEIVAVFVQGLTEGGFAGRRFLIFINNNFFFLSATCIGIFASFTLEYYIREVFKQRKTIDDDRHRIKTLLDTYGKQLALARTIQRSIMPDIPPHIDRALVTMMYKPMEELGGDYYDFIPLGEGKTGFFISDVTGHGIPAALVTTMLKTVVRSTREIAWDPGNFLAHLNSRLANLASVGFVTACYGVLDMPAMEFLYARAGHPFPILVRDGSASALESRGGFIGPMQKNNFETKSVSLKPGDRILLYTDGLIEAENEKGELFEHVLLDKMPQHLGDAQTGFLDAIYASLVSFRGDDHFEDDICMVGIEITR
ncbi:MAG: serine/threonine-protein phosphatase [Spirochaetes bacterium]|nr:serine/threonine-protein phosphatase [Spirochaetota bacterium]